MVKRIGKLRVALVAAMAFAAAQAGAQGYMQGTNGLVQGASDICAVLSKAIVPQSELLTLADAAKVSKCDATALYYSDDPARFQKARACGFAKLGLFRDDVDRSTARLAQITAQAQIAFPDKLDSADGLTLAAMYANGEGAEKNLPLAKFFACGYDERDQRAALLRRIDSGEPLKICEGRGSEFGYEADAICAAVQTRQRQRELRQAEESLAARIPALQRDSFLALAEAWDEFFTAYQNDPYGCQGPPCVAAQAHVDQRKQTEWTRQLQAIAEGHAPQMNVPATPLPELERLLNVAYTDNLKGWDDTGYVPTAVERLHTSQAAWLSYREAWVRFGTARWPEVSADRWRAWITSERLGELGS